MSDIMKNALLIIDLQKSANPKEEIIHSVEKLQFDYQFVFASRFINKNSPLIKHGVFNGYDDDSLAFKVAEHVKVFTKNIYSSFIPELANFKQVDICGYDTDACVYKTAMDLIEHDIRPRIFTKLCGSENEEFHLNGINLMIRNIGKDNLIF